jgi:hypothetical protein
MNITDVTSQQLKRAAAIKEKARCSEPRTPQPARWIIIEWSGIGEEAHDERGGEKENRRCAAGEMGEGEATLTFIIRTRLELVINDCYGFESKASLNCALRLHARLRR